MLVKVTTNDAPDAPRPTNPCADPRFLSPLVIEELPNGRNFIVYSEFDYHTDVFAVGIIRIPAGFQTDFASVPKLFWNILPPNGPYGKAAVIHDYLYRTPGQATKAEADDVFLEAMTALGVGFKTRYTMYWAVRMFGGRSYRG